MRANYIICYAWVYIQAFVILPHCLFRIFTWYLQYRIESLFEFWPVDVHERVLIILECPVASHRLQMPTGTSPRWKNGYFLNIFTTSGVISKWSCSKHRNIRMETPPYPARCSSREHHRNRMARSRWMSFLEWWMWWWIPSRNPCISHQIEEIKRIFPTFGWDMYGYVTFWHGKVHRHVFVHVSFFETALTSHTARGCLARMKCVHDIMLGIQRQKFEMDLGSYRRHIKQR